MADTLKKRIAFQAARFVPKQVLRPLDFSLVGAQKSGTSALWAYLVEHQSINGWGTKELHAYNDDTHDWSGNRLPPRLVWRLLKTRRDELAGDATPEMMYWPNAMDRLVDHSPDVKVLVLLRDPVDRAVSHWRMATRKGRETRSFAAAVDHEIAAGLPVIRDAYVGRGLYADQLDRITDLLPRERVLVLRSRDLRTDHATVLGRVLDHLDLPPFATLPAPHVHNAAPGDQPDTREGRERLAAVFREPHQRLADAWGVTFD